MKRRCYPEPWRQAEASHRARKARARVVHFTERVRGYNRRHKRHEGKAGVRLSRPLRRYTELVRHVLAG